MLFDTLFCFSIPTLVSDGTQKKNVPWHILAPRRGCFSNHLPLLRVRILAEHFDRIEAKFSIRSKRAVALTCDSPIGFRNDMNLKQSWMLQVIYALSDFLIMILSWLVKQSLRAFLFQEVQP